MFKINQGIEELINRVVSKQEKLELELDTMKSKIILSEDNANRAGKPRALTIEQEEWIQQQKEAGISVKDLAYMFAVTRQTVYNILKRDYEKAAEEYKRNTTLKNNTE